MNSRKKKNGFNQSVDHSNIAINLVRAWNEVEDCG